METKFKVGDLIQWQGWTCLIKEIIIKQDGNFYTIYDLKTGRVGTLSMYHTDRLYNLAGQ